MDDQVKSVRPSGDAAGESKSGQRGKQTTKQRFIRIVNM